MNEWTNKIVHVVESIRLHHLLFQVLIGLSQGNLTSDGAAATILRSETPVSLSRRKRTSIPKE